MILLALLVVAQLGRAEELAARQEIDAAVDVYKSALAAGEDGAALRYNLGTLALEQNRLGEAVLHLRAAKRFAPGDDDIRHNLAVALDMRTDRLSGELAPSPIRSVGEAVSPRVARVAFGGSLLLLALALAAFPFVPRVARVMLMASAIVVVMSGFVYASRKSFESVREAVVLAETTPALKDADPGAATMFVAHAGLYGDVVDERSPYVRVRFENGLEAWIARDALG